MCRADYTANRAVQGEILRAFQSLGLPVDWRHAGRRPPPADTLDEQFARIAMSGRAVGLVRQRMRIGHDEQRLIERLADHAMAERERRDRMTQARLVGRAEPVVAVPATRPAQARRQPQALPFKAPPAAPLVIARRATAHG